ncbi:MAG: sigma-54-dependent Fis family transcriptional regulator, partial [Oceanospirillaceae bacterium]
MSNDPHTKLITDSWQRCRDFGLKHDAEPELQKLQSADTEILLDIHRRLINTTDHAVLPYYDNILNNSPCLILLTDNQGQVLNSWGEQRFISKTQKEFFSSGASWQEVATGTNAIGTALTTGEAVQVQRDEHFLKRHRYMIGSASPIFDTNNELLAVLDISSDTYMPQAHTLGMVRLMSQSIENCLIFEKYHENNYLITINTHYDNLDSQWSGVIVVDTQGDIIGYNRRAELLLNFNLQGVSFRDICSSNFNELHKYPHQTPFELRVLDKYNMYAKVQAPKNVNHIAKTVTKSEQGLGSSLRVFLGGDAGLRKGLGVNLEVDFEHVEFGDQRLKRAIEQAKKVIEKDIPMLIFGETGVGKEVFVKALHQISSRSTKPLVALNCAAIPADLVESELFGYVKGAFTGADSKGSIGLIRQANKGILFLDEIGDMPLNVQGRLLRVLQERKVMPLGSTQAYPVDVKIISATHCNLKQLVEKELFRRDLFYRVSGLNIQIPPLRERADKQALFEHLLMRNSNNVQQSELPVEILALFMRHPWPGNIRQFISVLDVALAMAEDEPLENWHLPDDFYDDLRKLTASSEEGGNEVHFNHYQHETPQLPVLPAQLASESAIADDKYYSPTEEVGNR